MLWETGKMNEVAGDWRGGRVGKAQRLFRGVKYSIGNCGDGCVSLYIYHNSQNVPHQDLTLIWMWLSVVQQHMFVTCIKGSCVSGTVVMEDTALGQRGQHRELHVPSAVLCWELKAVLATSMKKGKEKWCILQGEGKYFGQGGQEGPVCRRCELNTVSKVNGVLKKWDEIYMRSCPRSLKTVWIRAEFFKEPCFSLTQKAWF